MSYVTIAEGMEPGDVLLTDSGTVERVENGFVIEAYGHKSVTTDPAISARFLNPYGNDEDQKPGLELQI